MMMDRWPGLSPDEASVVESVARFAERELAPRAAATDAEAAFVHEQLKGLAALGVMGANLPESAGGPGLSALALFAIVETVAQACGSTVSALTAHYLSTDAILLGGSKGQQARWLPGAAAGEVLGAFALTEPAAGSDPADMKSRATRTSQGWHLTGAKCFISNAAAADFAIVFAVTDPAAKHRGISAFIVPTNTAGFSVGPPERTMGLRGGHVHSVSLDCALPADSLLGGVEGKGFKTAMAVLDNGRLEVAAMALGIAEAAFAGNCRLRQAAHHRWRGPRQPSGHSLAGGRHGARHGTVAALALDGVRQRQTAHDTGQRFTLAASFAKLACSEMAGRVCDAALQIHGGYGFIRDFPIERLCRDARIFRIYEGSSEVQRNIISAHVFS